MVFLYFLMNYWKCPFFYTFWSLWWTSYFFKVHGQHISLQRFYNLSCKHGWIHKNFFELLRLSSVYLLSDLSPNSMKAFMVDLPSLEYQMDLHSSSIWIGLLFWFANTLLLNSDLNKRISFWNFLFHPHKKISSWKI